MFSFHSCCTIRSQKSREMSIKYDIVCYAWLYIFLYYTLYLHQPFIFLPSLYKKGPFSEGSYCKSPQSRALICSGPLFPDVLPNLGIEMADTSYRNSISTRINTHTHTQTHTLILRREI